MKRRKFITLLGGAAAAWTLAARAQDPAPTVRQARVGILSASPPTPAMVHAFRECMRERGYIEGHNLSIDVRWPRGTFEQDPAFAAELAKANVDVIVAWSTPAVIAARRATPAIPIVMMSVGDPVTPAGTSPRLLRVIVPRTSAPLSTVCRPYNCLPLRRRSREPSPVSELAPWERVLSE